MDHKPTALIYTNRLLMGSETFVRDQGLAMQRYHPCFVGGRRVNGLDLGAMQSVVVNEGGTSGKLREVRFKLFGPDARFLQQLRALRPQLLHAHFGGCATVALPLAESLGLPFVVTYHGLDATRTARNRRFKPELTTQLYLRRLPRLQQRADVFLTVTHYMRQVLLDQGFPEIEVRVHRLGIDTGFFAPDLRMPREPVVLFVGRLVEKKGCEYLIEAMGEVQRQVPEAELVAIGDGPLRASLESKAAGRLKRYRFLGHQPPADVRAWMNRARVFCVPSIVASSGDREGFGIVFLEAQSMGTPVVSFHSGGIPESVADGETGFLAPERDVAALTRHLTALLTDPALWNAFHERGMARVRREFDTWEQGRQLELLYDELVDRYRHRTDGSRSVTRAKHTPAVAS